MPPQRYPRVSRACVRCFTSSHRISLPAVSTHPTRPWHSLAQAKPVATRLGTTSAYRCRFRGCVRWRGGGFVCSWGGLRAGSIFTTLTVCIPDRRPHLAEPEAARSALRASTKPALARWVFGAVLALRVPRWSAPTAHSSHGPPRLVPAACHAQSACNNCAGGYYQGSKGQTSCHQVRPVCVLSREQVGDV